MTPDNLKILAIDDNKDNLTTLKAMLMDAMPACKLSTALSGPKGIQLAQSEDPDVILLDIIMPEMDGFEICRKLKADERSCSIPVVFLTALRTDSESRIKALEAGGEAFLAKPLDEHELFAQILAMTKIKTANRLQRLEREQLAALVAERTKELEKELGERKLAESALVESREFARATMDALSAHICVLDENGIIVAVNKAWLDFAEANPPVAIAESGERRAERLGNTGLGADYLAVCDAATGHDSEEAQAFAAGIREVMAGTRPEFEMEYPCHSPKEQRWFIGRVTHFAGLGSHMVAIAHENITESKLTEEALRQSEERLSTAVASGSMGIWGLDLRTNTSVWDTRTHDMFGIPRETAPTQEMWLEMIVPEDRPRAQASLERVVAEKRKDSVGYRITHPDGSIRYIQCTTDPVLDETGAVRSVVGLDLDITERKLAEIALRESEERFRAIASNTPDHIVMQDRQLRYTFVINPQLGLSEDDMIGKTDYDFLPGEEADLLTQAKTQVMESGEPVHFETSLTSEDGKPEYFDGSFVPRTDDQGNVIGLLGYFRNMTERKQAEEALKESEARLLTTLDATPFPVALVDLQDNKILFWSRSALTLFGHTAPSTPEWYQLAYPDPEYRRDVVERWKPSVEEARLSGLTVNTGEYRITCHDGSERLCELYATFRGDSLIVTFNDITERKLAEIALQQTSAKLVNLVAQVPGVVYQYRLYPDGHSCFPFASPGMNDIYEVTPEDVREDAAPVFGRLHPDDYDMVSASIQESARSLQHFHCEFRVVLPKQGLRWRLSDASPERMEDGGTLWYGIISDITHRKQAEEALKESEAKLELALTSSQMGVWQLDIAKKTRIFDNQTCFLLGIDPAEFDGTEERFLTVLHPDDRESVRKSLGI